MEDHVVEEVRRIRDEYAAQFDYDLDAIYADLKRMERESAEPRVSFGPRRAVVAVTTSKPSDPVADRR